MISNQALRVLRQRVRRLWSGGDQRFSDTMEVVEEEIGRDAGVVNQDYLQSAKFGSLAKLVVTEIAGASGASSLLAWQRALASIVCASRTDSPQRQRELIAMLHRLTDRGLKQLIDSHNSHRGKTRPLIADESPPRGLLEPSGKVAPAGRMLLQFIRYGRN